MREKLIQNVGSKGRLVAPTDPTVWVLGLWTRFVEWMWKSLELLTGEAQGCWVCHLRGQSDMRVSKTRIQREMGTVNARIRKFQKGTGPLDQSHYYAVFAENLVVFWHIIKEKLEWVWVSRTRSQLFDRDETAQHLWLVVLTALSEIYSENSQQKDVKACGLTEDCDWG